MNERFEWSSGRFTQLQLQGEGRRTLLLAHGAGTNQHHPLMNQLADALVGAGLGVVRFDYPYTSEGRKAPDRAPVLMECHRAVFERIRQLVGPPVLAGRSMGGRIGTMVAAGDIDAPAVIAYAYPLHPPGRPDRLRIDHLGSITRPLFIVRGERDSFSRPELFDRHVRSLPDVTVLDIPGEDHSLRKAGTATLIARETAHFLASLPPGR